MPLAGSGAALGAQIKGIMDNFQAQVQASPSTGNALATQMWIDIANVITAHIVANAQISTTVNTVVTGTCPVGPVAGTGIGAGVGAVL